MRLWGPLDSTGHRTHAQFGQSPLPFLSLLDPEATVLPSYTGLVGLLASFGVKGHLVTRLIRKNYYRGLEYQPIYGSAILVSILGDVGGGPARHFLNFAAQTSGNK